MELDKANFAGKAFNRVEHELIYNFEVYYFEEMQLPKDFNVWDFERVRTWMMNHLAYWHNRNLKSIAELEAKGTDDKFLASMRGVVVDLFYHYDNVRRAKLADLERYKAELLKANKRSDFKQWREEQGNE